MKQICVNCAHACLLSPKNVIQLKTVLCSFWSETSVNDSTCENYISHENSGFAHIQLEDTKSIIRLKYPFTQPVKLNQFHINKS